MKVAGISPFNHLPRRKCINGCLILIALRISSVTLLYKLHNATEEEVFRTNASSQKNIERFVLWYEFDSHGKFSHVKLLIKEKYPHTIITERFCCFNIKYGCIVSTWYHIFFPKVKSPLGLKKIHHQSPSKDDDCLQYQKIFEQLVQEILSYKLWDFGI